MDDRAGLEKKAIAAYRSMVRYREKAGNPMTPEEAKEYIRRYIDERIENPESEPKNSEDVGLDMKPLFSFLAELSRYCKANKSYPSLCVLPDSIFEAVLDLLVEPLRLDPTKRDNGIDFFGIRVVGYRGDAIIFGRS